MDASTSSQSLSRRSPLLSSDCTQSASVVSMRRRNGNSSGSQEEMMVRRLSEISTSSISFDPSKLAMYKNFSGRSSYARDLDGEALGNRLPRRCRTTGGYPSASRSPALSISEVDCLEEHEGLREHLKKEKEKMENKSMISFEQTPIRKGKTTVVSL